MATWHEREESTWVQIQMPPQSAELCKELRKLYVDADLAKGTQSHLPWETIHLKFCHGSARPRVFPIDLTNPILESAAAALVAYKDILQGKWTSEPEDPLEENDRDSVLGTQSVDGDQMEPDVGDDEVDVSQIWEDVKGMLSTSKLERFVDIAKKHSVPSAGSQLDYRSWEQMIPENVTNVIFEVDESRVTEGGNTVEEIANSFPRVKVEPSKTSRPKPGVNSNQKELLVTASEARFMVKPVADDLVLEEATLPSAAKPPPNSSQSGSNQSARRIPLNPTPGSSAARPDKHFSDLTAFLNHPPTDNEFGYRYQISHAWDDLDPSRKLSIAHARCIQGKYGEKIDDLLTCSHCEKHGYSCKQYHSSFDFSPAIILGSACQNCRVWDQVCDLTSESEDVANTPSKRESTARAYHTPGSSTFHRNTPSLSHSEPTGQPKTLKERMSKEFRIKGAAAAADNHSSPSFDEESPGSPNYTLTDDIEIGTIASSESPVHYWNARLDLQIRRPDVVEFMFNTWVRQAELPVKIKNLQHYYANLLDLAIIAHHSNDSDLEEKVLFKWQEANYLFNTEMPNIEIAIKAFNPNFLPADSALRDWITQSFSFLWSTEDHGDYGEFCRGLNLRPTPSEAFLYGIARVRCPFAKGEDIAVLNYWCKVHRHGGGPEERECKKWRDKVSNQALYHLLKEKEESRASEAEELIKVKGGVIVWKHKGIGSPIQTPTQQGKRKMPASGTVASRKKNKSGGTYGSSR